MSAWRCGKWTTTIARGRTWRMLWQRRASRSPSCPSRNRSLIRARATPPGGLVGSNEELGIEGYYIRSEGGGFGGEDRLAGVRVAGRVVDHGVGGIVDGLFSKDPGFRGSVGGTGARG